MCVFRFVPRKCQRAVSGCGLMRTNMRSQNYSAELLSRLLPREQVRLSPHFYILHLFNVHLPDCSTFIPRQLCFALCRISQAMSLTLTETFFQDISKHFIYYSVHYVFTQHLLFSSLFLPSPFANSLAHGHIFSM